MQGVVTLIYTISVRFNCLNRYCQAKWDDARNPYCPVCACPYYEDHGGPTRIYQLRDDNDAPKDDDDEDQHHLFDPYSTD